MPIKRTRLPHITLRFALRVSARALAGDLVFHDPRFANVAVEGKLYTARSARLAAQAYPGGFFVSTYLKARSLRYVQRIGYGFAKERDRNEISKRIAVRQY